MISSDFQLNENVLRITANNSKPILYKYTCFMNNEYDLQIGLNKALHQNNK